MSLLSPGKVSKFVSTLRDKTLRELEKPEDGRVDKKPDFEVKHEAVDIPEFNQDDNHVSKFPGVWDPWVGNGRTPW